MPGEEAAKPRLITNEHMPKAVSRAEKPFISPLDSVGGICYWRAFLSHFGGRFIQVFHTKGSGVVDLRHERGHNWQ